jgi:hypothetical protein
MKYLLTILLVVVGLTGYSQSFNYAYYDPCDGNLKTVSVPLGQSQIAVTYFNQVKSFDLIDLTNGVFDKWVKSTYDVYHVTSPCAGVGITNVITQSQSTTTTITGIVNTVANLSFPSPNAPDPNEPPATPDIDVSSDAGGGGGTGGDVGGGTTDGGSGGDEAGGGSDVMSGTSNSIKSSDGGGDSGGGSGGSSGGGSKSGGSSNKSSSNQKQNVLKPTVIGSSDLVAYSSADKTRGGKISGGYTSTRWDGLRTSGILFDYSTQIQGPNITGFYGWIGKKRTTLLSNTVSIGFEGKGALYNSVAFGQVVNWAGIKLVYMASASYGHIYKQQLIGTSAIVGAMYDFKIAKVIGVKLTSLLVYSPYMQYYNDLLLKSPLVVLPSIGTNVSLTKNFKINLNLGGAYQVGTGALNYSFIIGSRIAL